MKKLISALGKLLLLTGLQSSVYATTIVLPIVEVYDGDTIVSKLEVLPEPLNKVSIRIYGLDTPEIRTKCISEKVMGIKAREHLKLLLKNESYVIVKKPEWDKYGGRILGEVYTSKDVDISKEMISAGLAIAYTGGTKQPWCK